MGYIDINVDGVPAKGYTYDIEGGSGYLTVPEKWTFADAAERDAYFVANPDDLVFIQTRAGEGTTVPIYVGTAVQTWDTSTSQWVNSDALVGVKTSEIPLDNVKTNEMLVKTGEGTVSGAGIVIDTTTKQPMFEHDPLFKQGSVQLGQAGKIGMIGAFPKVTSKITGDTYQTPMHRYSKTSPTWSRPIIVPPVGEETLMPIQNVDTEVITTNPLVFQTTAMFNDQINGFQFKNPEPLVNLRISVSIYDANGSTPIYYFPSEVAWRENRGEDFPIGFSTIDISDSGLKFPAGTALEFDIRYDSGSISGDTNGIPYYAVYRQSIEEMELAMLSDVEDLFLKENKIIDMGTADFDEVAKELQKYIPYGSNYVELVYDSSVTVDKPLVLKDVRVPVVIRNYALTNVDASSILGFMFDFYNCADIRVNGAIFTSINGHAGFMISENSKLHLSSITGNDFEYGVIAQRGTRVTGDTVVFGGTIKESFVAEGGSLIDGNVFGSQGADKGFWAMGQSKITLHNPYLGTGNGIDFYVQEDSTVVLNNMADPYTSNVKANIPTKHGTLWDLMKPYAPYTGDADEASHNTGSYLTNSSTLNLPDDIAREGTLQTIADDKDSLMVSQVFINGEVDANSSPMYARTINNGSFSPWYPIGKTKSVGQSVLLTEEIVDLNANVAQELSLNTTHGGMNNRFTIESGNLKYTGTEPIKVLMEGVADLKVSSACELEFKLYKSGTPVGLGTTPHTFTAVNKVANIGIARVVLLQPNDYMHIYVEADSNTTVTIRTLSITALEV